MQLARSYVTDLAPTPERSRDIVLQRQLTAFNRLRLTPRVPDDLLDEGDARPHPSAAELHRLEELELQFLESERVLIADRAAEAPRDPLAFAAWFEALRLDGPGQGDRLFPWLAEQATLAQLRWFLCQEIAGEAGFEDLVALAQVRLPDQAKLEMARNYWDEMGRGKASGMHGPMLSRLGTALELAPTDDMICAESLALGNVMMAMAGNRQYAYHAVGALGIIEETAPDRAAHVNAGLKRLGVKPRDRQYFALHATLDIQHSAAWNQEVLIPLVRDYPASARAIAEGALLRLTAGARCFERYRAELGVA